MNLIGKMQSAFKTLNFESKCCSKTKLMTHQQIVSRTSPIIDTSLPHKRPFPILNVINPLKPIQNRLSHHCCQNRIALCGKAYDAINAKDTKTVLALYSSLCDSANLNYFSI